MGKPASADLKLGLATAPVLFAAHQVCLLFMLFALFSLLKYCSELMNFRANCLAYV